MAYADDIDDACRWIIEHATIGSNEYLWSAAEINYVAIMMVAYHKYRVAVPREVKNGIR